MDLFELRPAEIPTPITFREGGRKFRVVHVFRPPEFADWAEYEKALNSSVEIAGAYTRFDQARGEASEAIWDRVILRVEGYLVGGSQKTEDRSQESEGGTIQSEPRPEGSGSELPAAFPEAWREKVPLVHKMAAVTLLAQVTTADGNDVESYSFDPDQTDITLRAARGGKQYENLVHTLQRPTVRQQKEFSRVVSSALYVRGSRTEKSLLPSRLREMVKFYDELVVGVKGYGVRREQGTDSGPAVPSSRSPVPCSLQPATREEAVKFMDAMHKKTAVSALFSFEDSSPERED